jgi:probable phosphoglycerate mutase
VTRLFLIRHGESVAQVEGFLSGHDTCRGLSDLGRRQAQALHDRLARSGEITADVVLTSILPRAIETASIIGPAIGGGDALQDCDLCEIHAGEAEGLTWAEFGEAYPGYTWGPDKAHAPGAESWNVFGVRVARALRRYAEEHADKTIVAAVHGGVIEQSFFAFLGEGADVPLAHLVNTSITEWVFQPNPFRGGEPRWHLVRFNDHAHLDGVDFNLA